MTVGVAASLIIAALIAFALIPGRGDRAMVAISGTGAEGGLVYAALVLNPIGSGWAGTEIGRAPLTTLLEPGVYRFTIVAEDGNFAQTARHLLPSSENEIDLPVVEPDTNRMVLVPACEIEVGLNGHTGGMGPHRVRVEAFYIDDSEVSNAEYKSFLDTTGADEFTPLSWLDDGYDDSLADHPVTEIKHAWMQAYAAWAGKRLPSIEEWEAAHIASGIGDPGKRLGPDAIGTKASQTLEALRLAYKKYTMPANIETETETGGIGLNYMDGNVREATLTWYERPVTGIVLKGAAYVDDISFVGRDVTAIAPPNGAPSPHLGFRCVRSVTFDKQEQ